MSANVSRQIRFSKACVRSRGGAVAAQNLTTADVSARVLAAGKVSSNPLTEPAIKNAFTTSDGKSLKREFNSSCALEWSPVRMARPYL